VWSVIKRWLDPVTVDKISILGSNYQPTLLQQIPAENLPSQFGGDCRCKGGCELSDEGPWQDPQWLGPQEKKTAPAGIPEEANTTSAYTEPVAPGAVATAGDEVPVQAA
jgi:CRAL/TRIO domain